MQQSAHTPNWQWAQTDLNLLLQQFKALSVTQQYREKQQQLAALGPEGKGPLAKAQMDMLSKVVDDFLVQLGPLEPGAPPELDCCKHAVPPLLQIDMSVGL